MDTTDLAPQIEDLEANIDELEDSLSPLLTAPLLTTASSLPLLDRAKLHVLTAYAVESLLFSSLQASGIDAKEHAIFAELGRLKGYFKKIKDAELGLEPKARIDKGAAARFIKHGLAGNDKYDAERKERMEREKENARLKAGKMHIKFDEAGEGWTEVKKPSEKRRVEVALPESGEEEEHDVESENAEMYGDTSAQKHEEKEEDKELAARPKKKQRISAADMNDSESPSPSMSTPSSSTMPSKHDKKLQKRLGRTKAGMHRTHTVSHTDKNGHSKSKEERRAERREKKQQRRAERAAASGEGEKDVEMVIPQKEAPRAHSETFKALLEGPLKKKDKKGKGR